MTNAELLRYISYYQSQCGYPATIRELAAHFGVNEKTVRNRLRKLAEQGDVRWRPGEHRTVQVMAPRRNMKAKSIPM